MKKIKTLHFLILMIFLIASCGGEEKSKSKLSIDLSALTGAAASATGGLILVGHKTDDSISFSRTYNISDPTPTFELVNGEWEFYLAIWEGGTKLTGNTKCAYSGKHNLKGTETTISFTITTNKCSLPLPDGSIISEDFEAGTGAWPVLHLTSCLDTPSTCTTTGLTQSFKVKASSENKNFPQPGSDSLHSECNQYLTSPQATTIRVPTGAGGDGGVIQVEVQLFTSTDCSGESIKYNFKDGLKANFSDLNFESLYTFSNPIINLKLNHNYATPVSAPDINLTQFGTGANGNSVMSGAEASVRTIPTSNSMTVASGDASNFNIGEEVMWYVVSDSGSYCGDAFKPGYYGFQRISSISANTINFFGDIIPNLGGGNLLTNSSELEPLNNQCIIQITKVANYDSLILDSSGIYAAPYDSSTGKGGIIALRVKDTLEMKDSSFIKAYETGFQIDFPSVNYGSDCSTRACLPLGRGAPPIIPLNGTVELVGTALTGTGTTFDLDLLPGDNIEINGHPYIIDTIGGPTAATVLPSGGSESSGSSFQRNNPPGRGGGIVYVAAKKLKFSNSGGGATISASTNIREAHGGTVKVIAAEVESTNYFIDNNYINSNTSPMGFSGMPGEASLHYCLKNGAITNYVPDIGTVVYGGPPQYSNIDVLKNITLCP